MLPSMETLTFTQLGRKENDQRIAGEDWKYSYAEITEVDKSCKDGSLSP